MLGSQNEPTCGTAESERRQYHIEIDDEIQMLDHNIYALEDLVREVNGDCIPEEAKDKICAPTAVLSISEFLRTASETIRTKRSRFEDLTIKLRELLF